MQVAQSGAGVWLDVTVIAVPAKTKRRTVIARAAEHPELKKALAEGGQTLRVIPDEHAVGIPVEMEQPPPQLRIGER